jgi:hypothetical protein
LKGVKTMEVQVKQLLKEKGKLNLFTDHKYELAKRALRFYAKTNKPFKEYVKLDPMNRADFLCHMIIKISEESN